MATTTPTVEYATGERVSRPARALPGQTFVK